MSESGTGAMSPRAAGSRLALAALLGVAGWVCYQLGRSSTTALAPVPTDTAPLPAQPGLLSALSAASQQLSEGIAPCVVRIDTTPSGDLPLNAWSEFFGSSSDQQQLPAQGSGFVVDSDGYLMTNWHVVHAGRAIRVLLADGRELESRLVGADPLTDLAVLKVEAKDLPAIQWGDSESLAVGALVWAVGSPFGLESSISFGILSAKHRRGLADSPYQDFLQTDAAINPGNSGGPLVDAEGRVVGVTSAIVGPSFRGVSFAIPSHIAQDIYQRLLRDGKIERGWLGVTMDQVTPERQSELGLQDSRGAYVVSIESQGQIVSPAVAAGIRSGDVILQWDGKPVSSANQMSWLIAHTPVGREVALQVWRKGQMLTLQVAVGARPDDSP